MQKRVITRAHTACFVPITVLLALCAITTRAADVAIVVHPDVQTSALSADELRSIFLGQKTKWEDGTSVTLTTLTTAEPHEIFLKSYIKKTPSQFRIFWKRLVFSGKGREPKAFPTTSALLAFIAQTKGAIGYVPAEQAAEPSGLAGCKVLKIVQPDQK